MSVDFRHQHERLAVAGMGGSVAVVGLVMITGWVFRQASIVRLIPGTMVFDTALAFAISGLALMAGALAPAWHRYVKTAAGIALMALGVSILSEYAFHASLAIDWPGLHTWLPDPGRNPFPGRAPCATALGIAMAGLVFFGVPRVRNRFHAWGVRALAATLGGVGALAAAAHLSGLHRMIEDFWLDQLSPLTAACFVILSLAMWLDWRAEPWSMARVVAKEDERIVFAGVIASAAISAAAGLAVYWPMQAAMKSMLTDELALDLRARHAVLTETVGRSIDEVLQVSRLPLVVDVYTALSARAGIVDHPGRLAAVAESVVHAGFSGMVFFDASGRELGRAGAIVRTSSLHLPLRVEGGRAELLWIAGLVLEVRTDIVKDGVLLGELRAQRPLKEMARTMAEVSPMGIPGEFVMCAARAEMLHCAPSGLQPWPFEVPATLNGKRMPMSYALAGGTGVIEATDYRGHAVVAAYMPMLGAGLVLKADTRELYAPVRSRVGMLALILLLAVAAGSLILRLSVKPLARRLVATREQLRAASIEDKRVEQSLRQLNDELRVASEANRIAAAVIGNSEEGVMVIDADLRIASVNPAFERITGYAAAEAVGRTPKFLFSGRQDQAFFERLREQLDAQGSWQGEIWNRRSNGEVFPQQTSFSALRDPDGRITHYAAVFRDRSDDHQLETRLRELAALDGLTGIPNRRSFDETLARELWRALREGGPVSLAMADIDHFKRYNDRHGHPAGDDCLRRVAQAIAGAAQRAGDQAARYGGEEFVVVLPNTDAAAAAVVAEKIRASVAALELPHGESSAGDFVTISVGVATLTPVLAGEPFEPIGASRRLISLADQALYLAKASGRNRVAAAPVPDPSAALATDAPPVATL